jgi:hypothetical protein
VKYLPFTDLLDAEPANIAILSTYELDPDFFERRLLRCGTLAAARRILVFLDARHWYKLQRQDTQARSLNWRYLVVPVYRSQGVFHPKLSLLLYEKGGQVLCGSNNLTRSGCSGNLELLNAFTLEADSGQPCATNVAQDVFRFFGRVCDDAEEEPAKIARKWLAEAAASFPWLTRPMPATDDTQIKLLHTYEGSLWDRITTTLDATPPRRLLVISPFHDLDGDMLKRVHRRWPKCQIEVVVQQQITSLPHKALATLKSSVSLSEVVTSKRRLHAKLLAWEADDATGCLVGSANFTAAAFDARNVETCLLVKDAAPLVRALFDNDLRKRPVAMAEFEPGTEREPGTEKEETTTNLRIRSALLLKGGQLRISYRTRLPEKPSSLHVAIRTPGEPLPRTFASVAARDAATTTVPLPCTVLEGVHGTILASLVAEFPDHRAYSAPVWVIQEHRLTYEPSSESQQSAEKRVRETGEGLPEILDEIGKRDGRAAVIEYLRHTNIRFNDGTGGLAVPRPFRLRMHDPFHPDVAPDWLAGLAGGADDLAEAIRDFVERHEWRRLRKHARRGNVNGMDNFLDVFTALIRLLYVYYVRSIQMTSQHEARQEASTGYYGKGQTLKEEAIVGRGQLIGNLCRFIDIATGGIHTTADEWPGFLLEVAENLNNRTVLAEVARKTSFAAEVRAALMIAQRARFNPNEKVEDGPPPKRPRDVLRIWSNTVRETFADVGVAEPSKADVRSALERYRMFSEQEVSELLNELDGQ